MQLPASLPPDRFGGPPVRLARLTSLALDGCGLTRLTPGLLEALEPSKLLSLSLRDNRLSLRAPAAPAPGAAGGAGGDEDEDEHAPGPFPRAQLLALTALSSIDLRGNAGAQLSDAAWLGAHPNPRLEAWLESGGRGQRPVSRGELSTIADYGDAFSALALRL